MKQLIDNKLIKQILKFIVVGGSAFLIDYLLMIFLKEVIHINYLVASIISFCVSVIYNYLLSIFWVFETDKSKSTTTTFTVFIVLSVIGLVINTIMMYLLVDGTKLMPYTWAKIIATAVVMVYNFISRKIFLEKKKSDFN